MSDHLRLSAHLHPPPVDLLPPPSKPQPTGMPDGYYRVDASEVWTDGETVVVFGDPADPDEDPDAEHTHSCDHLGCGSVGPHVVLIGRITHRDHVIPTVKETP